MYSKWTICTVHVQSVQSMNNMHVTLTIFKVHEQSVQYMNLATLVIQLKAKIQLIFIKGKQFCAKF